MASRYTMSQSKRKTIYNKFDGHCAYCGCKIDYSEMVVDHYIAFSKDGVNDNENLMPSCNLCNAIKFNLSIEDFRNKIALLTKDSLPKIKLLTKYYYISPKQKDFLFYFETIKGGV